jgi:hypothetical protein
VKRFGGLMNRDVHETMSTGSKRTAVWKGATLTRMIT